MRLAARRTGVSGPIVTTGVVIKSPAVRDFLIRNAGFLLDEYRIDGLRYDQVSVIDHEGRPHGWRFCQDLSSTVRYLRPGALQLAEYWDLNPWVVRPVSEGGAGFDATLSNTLRIAVRDVLAAASVPGTHPLPMTRLAASLWPKGFANAWCFVQGPENHDIVLRDPDAGLLPYLASERPDVVFPALHGSSGEDGSLLDLLNALGVPTVGSTGAAARACRPSPMCRSGRNAPPIAC